MTDWTPDQPHPISSHELVAIGMMRGLTSRQAAEEFGVHWKTAANDKRIAARAAYLRELFLAMRGMDCERWAEQLVELVNVDITDVVEWGTRRKDLIRDPETGQDIDPDTGEAPVGALEQAQLLIRDSASLPAHVKRAIKKVKITQLPLGGQQVEVELHDRLKALDMLGRYVGAYDPPDQRPKPAVPLTQERALEIRRQGLERLSNAELAAARMAAWSIVGERPQAMLPAEMADADCPRG